MIAFAKGIPRGRVDDTLVRQFVRSGTSVGANYCEADDAGSKKDFRYKISICKREARETKYWVRMIVSSQPQLKEKGKALWQEAKELHLIFAAILRKGKG